MSYVLKTIQVARQLGYTGAFVLRLVHAGLLEAQRGPEGFRFTQDAIDRYRAKHPTKPSLSRINTQSALSRSKAKQPSDEFKARQMSRVQASLEPHGAASLTTDYKGTKQRIEVRCINGHVTDMVYRRLVEAPFYCRVCKLEERQRQKTPRSYIHERAVH